MQPGQNLDFALQRRVDFRQRSGIEENERSADLHSLRVTCNVGERFDDLLHVVRRRVENKIVRRHLGMGDAVRAALSRKSCNLRDARSADLDGDEVSAEDPGLSLVVRLDAVDVVDASVCEEVVKLVKRLAE